MLMIKTTHIILGKEGKMKNNLLILLLALSTFTSCSNERSVTFEIHNKTEHQIDSLKIEPNTANSKKLISIKKGEIVEYEIDMTNIEKIDGSYQLSFLINEEIRVEKFGYYTNGYPLEKFMSIEIVNDTIIVEYPKTD